MFNKRIFMSLALVASFITIVGSGFAVWNFETTDETAKGVYNFGLYVTPNVSSFGTVSVNKDYALILDQGKKIIDTNNSDIPVDSDFEKYPDYYKRGITVGELTRNKNYVEGSTDLDKKYEFEVDENNNYKYTNVNSLCGVWVQSQEDAKTIAAENINDLAFTTKIRLKKKLAKYVQVRNDGTMGIENETVYSVSNLDKTSLGEDEYVEYLYEWGLLSDVLVVENGEYHTEYKKSEVCKVAQDPDFKNKHCGSNPTGDSWENDETYLDKAWLANHHADLDELPPGFKISGRASEEGVFRYSSLGLCLKPCKAVLAYTVYDINNQVIAGYFTSEAEAQSYISNNSGSNLTTYLTYYRFYNASAGDIEIFMNEAVDGYTNVESSLTSEATQLTIKDKVFNVVDCYYFDYTFNSTTDPDTSENARFIYYPFTQKKSYESIADAIKDATDLKEEDRNDLIVNTLLKAYQGENANSYGFVRKPATVEEYQNMLNDFDTVQSQFVDLKERYVVIEFVTQLITKSTENVDSTDSPEEKI